jgi:hypothetical protein
MTALRAHELGVSMSTWPIIALKLPSSAQYAIGIVQP